MMEERIVEQREDLRGDIRLDPAAGENIRLGRIEYGEEFAREQTARFQIDTSPAGAINRPGRGLFIRIDLRPVIIGDAGTRMIAGEIAGDGEHRIANRLRFEAADVSMGEQIVVRVEIVRVWRRNGSELPGATGHDVTNHPFA